MVSSNRICLPTFKMCSILLSVWHSFSYHILRLKTKLKLVVERKSRCFQLYLVVQDLLWIPLRPLVARWLLGVPGHRGRLSLLYHRDRRDRRLCLGIQVHLEKSFSNTCVSTYSFNTLFSCIKNNTKRDHNLGHVVCDICLLGPHASYEWGVECAHVNTFKSGSARPSWASWSSSRSWRSHGAHVSFLTCSQTDITNGEVRTENKQKMKIVITKSAIHTATARQS